LHEATASPIAAEALKRIAELYAIEATIRGQPAQARQATRSIKSLPLVQAIKIWLEAQLKRIPPKGGLADAIRYALTRWEALCRFLDDGRIELDNNTVERAIRPIALGRKNHLFAGSDGGAKRDRSVESSGRGFLAGAPRGVEAQRLESTAVLRSGGYPAQGVRQLAGDLQGRAAAA
jgi:hypothetical protein